MKLFETLDEFKPYLFRIVDNGGETYDRFTIITCDGDAILATESGIICTTVETLDVQGPSDNVEAGTEIDLRWIDLPEAGRRGVLNSLNSAFADMLKAEPAAPNRDKAESFEGLHDQIALGIYRDGDAFRVRDDDRHREDGQDPGPFATYREAVLYTLPEDYSLAGPEYHTTVDLWDEEGGPAPLWDSEANPATPYEVQPWAKDRDLTPHFLPVIAEARDPEHAAEIAAAWRADNPDLATAYDVAYINKVDRVVQRMD